MTTAQILEKSVRALGGTWDTQRAVTALRDAGIGTGTRRQQEKRAREALRVLGKERVIVRTDPHTATYRTTEQ
ncbi:hypothetical protein [Streptomyces sp. NPDC059783]|uniref:hypothetical protein n=1 Tax=Streptomyces sp. NPDC059783 TaxID=3346944 RepID=UPI00365FBCB8